MGWSPYRKTGLTHHQPSQTFKGYTLVTPSGADAAYLIDMDGRIVQRWRTPDLRAGYAQLLPSGNLLLRGVDASLSPLISVPPDSPPPPFAQQIRRLGAFATHLRELDWEGNTVWEYREGAFHHDMVRLANGNTLLPIWVELPDEVEQSVRGGAPARPDEQLPRMISDDIIEIDPVGKEVWRVSLWKLLDPETDAICPLETRWEWTHVNALSVTGEGNVVFSCRQNSRVGIIERGSGILLWKHGWPETSHQHNATALPNGNIQIFDNGMHRVGLPRSRVVELDPKDNKVVWEYIGEPAEQFFSGHVSGADRLPGGNVLICEGAPGRLFEVTPRGETVWEWINPFVTRVQGRLMPLLFRAHRYAPDYSGLADRRLDPAAYADLNRLHGLE
ncbi:MAG: aryl-sulfate sulfotransferase [Dehalococcoidia bacterium]